MKLFHYLLIVSAVLLLFSGCSEERVNIATDTSIPVRVNPVELKPIKEFVPTTGSLFAINDALLNVEQVGDYRLQKNPRTGKPFAMGDRVLKGEIVILFENREFENSIAITSKKMAHDSAKREFEKQKVVHAKGGITLKEVDDAERAFVDTTYSYENGQISLDKLKVKAPFSGIIVDLPYYGPGMRVAAGEPVLRLMDYSSLFTDVTLPGKEMVRVKRGQKAVISNYSSSETLEGLVTQVSSALDPDSRMFKLRVEVGNSDSMLKPGMFARVDIVVSEKESTLVIPREIILERRGAKTVFIVQRGIAQERRLKTGLSNRDEIEVLEGLAKDDSLVIEGFETLRNRSRVKVLK